MRKALWVCVVLSCFAALASAGTWDFIHQHLQDSGSSKAQEALATMNAIINEEFHPLALRLLEAEQALANHSIPFWERHILTALKPKSYRAHELLVIHAENELELIEEKLEGVAQETRFNATVFSRLFLAEVFHSFADSWSKVSQSSAMHALNDLYDIPDIDLPTPMPALLDPIKDEAPDADATDLLASESTDWLALVVSTAEVVLSVTAVVVLYLLSVVLSAVLYAIAAVILLFRFFYKSWVVIGRYSPTPVERVVIWVALQIPIVLVSGVVASLVVVVLLAAMSCGGSSEKEKEE